MAAHRAIINSQSWRHSAPLLVLDEIHKMRDWKAWLKGVADGRPVHQALLVTGSARMDTFRQAGESLAGRFFHLRLHPLSVREWCQQVHSAPHAATLPHTPAGALTHLLKRGVFPENAPDSVSIIHSIVVIACPFCSQRANSARVSSCC